MPIPTPFHERTSKLCHSYRWKDWAGYYAVSSFQECHEREYYAFRHAAGMMDVTPLFKYEVSGKDAARFLARVTVKNVPKMKVGQVTYTCWCDDDGKMVDDGTITRVSEDYFRVTAAEPSLFWFAKYTRGYDVQIQDVTASMAALSLQGPNSRDILKKVSDADMDGLKFFRSTEAKLNDVDVTISRTGYTGDLGYEIWSKSEDAIKVWDAIYHDGEDFGVQPCGLDALDVTRVEAGFIMNGVDYYSANHCLIDARKSSPYELGLGWTVNLKREPFIGQEALKKEKVMGSPRVLVGLEMDWVYYEKLCNEKGLPPQIGSGAWRTPIPIYNKVGRQVGYANSGSWSPVLKKNLALATVLPEYSKEGGELMMEMTIEYERKNVPAKIVQTPFFNPERKRA